MKMDARVCAPDSFDLLSASTIFWDSVPVSLRVSDRSDTSEETYMFRMLLGNRRDGKRTPTLRIYVFSESRPYFLQTLECSEDDFQTLKAEQGILVDFKHFSGKVTDLLRRSIEAHNDGSHKFKAVLSMSELDSQLQLVETNDFKQIPHICLSFRCGSDDDIKSFLAYRLNEVRIERDSLLTQVSSTRCELQSVQEELQAQCQNVKAIETSQSSMLMQATAAAKQIQASAHRELIKQREDLMTAHEREKTETQQAHSHQADILRAEVMSLNEQVCSLRQNKHILEHQLDEALNKLSAGESVVASLRADVKSLTLQVQHSRRERDELGEESAKQRSQLSSLEEKLFSLEQELVKRVNDAAKLDLTVNCQSEQLHKLTQDISDTEQSMTEMSEEVAKGNRIICDLTADLKLTGDKLKRKQLIICQQEERITQMANEGDACKLELKKSQETVVLMSEAARQMQLTENNLTGKLHTCKKQLEGNEQMIRWLNSQPQRMRSGLVSQRYAAGQLPMGDMDTNLL